MARDSFWVEDVDVALSPEVVKYDREPQVTIN